MSIGYSLSLTSVFLDTLISNPLSSIRINIKRTAPSDLYGKAEYASSMLNHCFPSPLR